jgi:hypothetical protein
MGRARLHVVCGDAAASALRASGVCDPRAIRIQHDVLSVGPLPPFADLPAWCATRLRFWRSEVWPEAPSFDTMPADLMARAADLREADSVVLWASDALSEQLLLPSTARIAELAGVPELPLEVAHLPADGAVLRRVWGAITAPEPAGLTDAMALAQESFPPLARALGFFLTKYPDIRTGLSRWDQELLRYAPGSAVQLVGRALRGNEEWLDPVGDLFLHARLARLADARLARPALQAGNGVLAPTRFGEDVLAGTQNFVEHNGIDEWIAGVHLHAASGRVWFREGATLVPRGA